MKSSSDQEEQNKPIKGIILDKQEELTNFSKKNDDNTKKELNLFKNEVNCEFIY